MRGFDLCLNYFVQDLRNTKKLSANENLSLVRMFKETGERQYLNEIILGNIWFIISRAKRYTNRYLSASDLIYSGIKGIIRAAKKFESDRQIKFITYASHWIDMYMRREVIYNSSIVKMTPRAWGMALTIGKMKDSGATEDEIVEKLKIGKNTLRKLRNSHIDMSLNALINEEHDSEELENIILVDNQTPADICSEHDRTQYLISAVRSLKKREREIIERKFGLKESNSENLMQISRAQDVSPERIRQILKSGLKKLKKSLVKKELIN